MNKKIIFLPFKKRKKERKKTKGNHMGLSSFDLNNGDWCSFEVGFYQLCSYL